MRFLRSFLAFGGVSGCILGCILLPFARIDITNDSLVDIEDVRVIGRCSEGRVGRLEAGRSTTVWVSTTCGEGAPELRFRQAGREERSQVGYVGARLIPRRLVRLGAHGASISELALGGPFVLTPWPLGVP